MVGRYLLSVYAGLLFGALAGGLVGFVLQLATGQAGWSLTLGSLGACFGAMWAGLRRADNRLFWRSREPLGAEPAPRGDPA